jgi:protein O-mannosyl-transferase
MNPSNLYPRLILVAVIGMVYSNTFLNSFHFDDITSILEKPWVRGLDKMSELFNKQALFQRPLVLLSFNINYIISEFEVPSYHLFNIMLHALASLLVFLFAGRALNLLDDFSPHKAFSSLPFLGAMVFALHPLSTQSVTYI